MSKTAVGFEVCYDLVGTSLQSLYNYTEDRKRAN